MDQVAGAQVCALLAAGERRRARQRAEAVALRSGL
eukprot:COSAG05_NODE_885_length_6763_cov_10.115396_3_plen_35_part_00